MVSHSRFAVSSSSAQWDASFAVIPVDRLKLTFFLRRSKKLDARSQVTMMCSKAEGWGKEAKDRSHVAVMKLMLISGLDRLPARGRGRGTSTLSYRAVEIDFTIRSSTILLELLVRILHLGYPIDSSDSKHY